MKCQCCGNVNKNKKNKNNERTDRLWYWFYILLFISIVVLGIGVLGYYVYHHRDWIDAFYNATAVMSGVGAADTPNGHAAQLFASFYTLGIGFFYITIITAFIITVLSENDIFIEDNED